MHISSQSKVLLSAWKKWGCSYNTPAATSTLALSEMMGAKELGKLLQILVEMKQAKRESIFQTPVVLQCIDNSAAC
jgi:hypothetical protein